MKCSLCGGEMGDTTAHTCPLVMAYLPTPVRQPWKCPVCNGTGKVGTTTTVAEVPCHACNGSGIVWG